jgi:hypothetical protein
MSDIPLQLFEIYEKKKVKYLMNNNKNSIMDNKIIYFIKNKILP